jgi:hypothetical protein
LKAGDLVWFELENPDTPISVENIVSIQWARWGREGIKLTKLLPDGILPDYKIDDGNVATVTDMFGMTPVNNKESKNRFNTWKATQKPVKMLRYPRAATGNKNKITRGGLTWFSNLGTPQKKGESGYQGMQTVSFVDQNIVDQNIQGQVLPTFKNDTTDFFVRI